MWYHGLHSEIKQNWDETCDSNTSKKNHEFSLCPTSINVILILK